MNKNVVLSANNIEKSFPGTKALKGVSIELMRKEVHAVVGENGAGKSTLMNIISGVYQSDAGDLLLDGRKIEVKNPNDAGKAGIGIVHQELALCPHLTVAENICIGRTPVKGGIIDRTEQRARARKVLSPFKTSIDPDDIVSDLSVAQQQIVEIAKVLSIHCKVIIFDEPTSSLNESEAQRLMEIIEDIKNQGIGIFYISHKLSEIFQMCDRISIMRDGNMIETRSIQDVNSDYVVSTMVGREITNLYPEKTVCLDEKKEILKVEGLTRFPRFKDVSFSVRKGEIVGLSGLVGSGRTEVSRAICGLDKKAVGDVYIEGKKVTIKNHLDALNHGLCYLSEDRKLDGLFVDMSLSDNMMAPELDRISRLGIIDKKHARRQLLDYKEKLNIKFAAPDQKMSSLSGGNQQKIMIAKLLALHPKLIIMDEPTRGIDVGAKSEIHAMLRSLSDDGIGVIVISSEMPEMVGVCDRVVIMNEGRVIGELEGADVTQDMIIEKISEFGGEK